MGNGPGETSPLPQPRSSTQSCLHATPDRPCVSVGPGCGSITAQGAGGSERTGAPFRAARTPPRPPTCPLGNRWWRWRSAALVSPHSPASGPVGPSQRIRGLVHLGVGHGQPELLQRYRSRSNHVAGVRPAQVRGIRLGMMELIWLCRSVCKHDHTLLLPLTLDDNFDRQLLHRFGQRHLHVVLSVSLRPHDLVAGS